MADATRKTEITLVLTEQEACDVYCDLKLDYSPTTSDKVKKTLRTALGYTPDCTEVPF